MDTQPMCSKCSTPLPEDAPDGLCPQCLMKAGFPTDAAADDAHDERVEPPVNALALGDIRPQFPQLEILEILGRGGMGMVLKARQPELDRVVALKILLPGTAQIPTFEDRFGREARTLAKLSHPNIVAIHDTGKTESGLYYLIMEFVDGTDLRQMIRGNRLSPREALAIVPHICDALQYAHDQGIVHRDIKPENILLDRQGRVKIADFGLAKLIDPEGADPTLTGTRQVMGTPRYMAPEQFTAPQAVDHRADIYALGAVLYEMLTGEPPMGHFAPPSRRVEVDVRVDGVVLKALDREPERRYQHASEVGVDVEAIRQHPQAAAVGAVGAGAGAATGGSGGKGLAVGCVIGLLAFPALLVCVAIAGILAALWMPVAQRAGTSATIARESGHLKQIGLALINHADENEGRFPDDLAVLVETGAVSDGALFVVLEQHRPLPHTAEDIRAGNCDLEYFGAGKRVGELTPEDAMVSTKPGLLPNNAVISVQGDGSVRVESRHGRAPGRDAGTVQTTATVGRTTGFGLAGMGLHAMALGVVCVGGVVLLILALRRTFRGSKRPGS